MAYSVQTANAFALLEADDDDAPEIIEKEETETSVAGNKVVEPYSNNLEANTGVKRESSGPTRGGYARGDRSGGPRGNRSDRYYSREGDDRRFRGSRDGRGRGRGRSFGSSPRGGTPMSNGFSHNDAARVGEEEEQGVIEGKEVDGTFPHENGNDMISNGKTPNDEEDITASKEEEEEEEKQVSYDEYLKEQEEKRKNLNTRREVSAVMEKFDGMTVRERKEEEFLVVGGKEKNEKVKKERKEKIVIETGFRAPSVDKPRRDFRKDGPPRGRGRFRGGDGSFRGGGRRGRGEGRGRYSSPRLDVEDTNAFPSLS